MVQLQDVTVRYGSVHALGAFNLQVEPGEFMSILGRSGAGKTTALRVIAGFERVTSGYVRINGRLVGSLFAHIAPDQRRVGVVFQDYALFPHLTVAENVAFGLQDSSRRERDSKAMPMIELSGLSGLEKRYPHELSGGQQQRVALARALAPRPVALLLDEPFSNLDRELRDTLRRDVGDILKRSGATTILVTHDREEALAMADRIAVMGPGFVEQVGTPADVYRRPVSAAVAKLTGPCDLIAGRMAGTDVLTDAGVFPADASEGPLPASGASVIAMLRPADLEITPSESESACTVVSREFRGEFTDYTVAIYSGGVIVVRRRSEEALQLGQRVAVRSRAGSRVIVFARTT